MLVPQDNGLLVLWSEVWVELSVSVKLCHYLNTGLATSQVKNPKLFTKTKAG